MISLPFIAGPLGRESLFKGVLESAFNDVVAACPEQGCMNSLHPGAITIDLFLDRAKLGSAFICADDIDDVIEIVSKIAEINFNLGLHKWRLRLLAGYKDHKSY